MLDLFSLIFFSVVCGAATAAMIILRVSFVDEMKKIKSSHKVVYCIMVFSLLCPIIIIAITGHRIVNKLIVAEKELPVHAEVAHTTQCIAGINYIIIGEGTYKNITPKIDVETGDAELCDKKSATTTEKK